MTKTVRTGSSFTGGCRVAEVPPRAAHESVHREASTGSRGRSAAGRAAHPAAWSPLRPPRRAAEARRHVEDPHGKGRAEDVESARARERDRQRHRTQYAYLAGALHEGLGHRERARRALEAEQLDASAV